MKLLMWRKPPEAPPQGLRQIDNVTFLPNRGTPRSTAASLSTVWHARQQIVLLTVVGIALGVLLAAQFQSKPSGVVHEADSSRDLAVRTVQRLEAEQSDLKKQIASLRAQIDAQQSAATGKETTSDISQELEKQKIIAGMVPLKGPGVRVLLDDSTSNTIPANDDPALYLVHEYHIRDVINVLWGAGAEAISVNGERMMSGSSIYCVGSTILVNDTRMSPPYEILVIGDSPALEAALARPDILKSLKSRVQAYSLQFKVERGGELVLPAYAGSLDFRYATTGEPSAAPTKEKQQQ